MFVFQYNKPIYKIIKNTYLLELNQFSKQVQSKKEIQELNELIKNKALYKYAKYELNSFNYVDSGFLIDLNVLNNAISDKILESSADIIYIESHSFIYLRHFLLKIFNENLELFLIFQEIFKKI